MTYTAGSANLKVKQLIFFNSRVNIFLDGIIRGLHSAIEQLISYCSHIILWGGGGYVNLQIADIEENIIKLSKVKLIGGDFPFELDACVGSFRKGLWRRESRKFLSISPKFNHEVIYSNQLSVIIFRPKLEITQTLLFLVEAKLTERLLKLKKMLKFLYDRRLSRLYYFYSLEQRNKFIRQSESEVNESPLQTFFFFVTYPMQIVEL